MENKSPKKDENAGNSKFKIGLPNITNFDLGKIEFQTRYNFYIAITFATSLIVFLSIFGLAGRVGSLLAGVLFLFMGKGSVLILIFIIIWGINLIKIQKQKTIDLTFNMRYAWGSIILLVTFLGYLSLFNGIRTPSDVASGGGFIGYFMYPVLLGRAVDFGPIGSFFVLLSILIFGALLISDKTYSEIIDGIKYYARHIDKIWDLVPDIFQLYKNFTTPKEKLMENTDQDKESQLALEDAKSLEMGNGLNLLENKNQNNGEMEEKLNFDDIEIQTGKETENSENFEKKPSPTTKNQNKTQSNKKIENWRLPSMQILILEKNKKQFNTSSVEENKRKIIETFKSFGIEITIGEAITGPTVSQYTFRPQSGVKLSRIAALSQDLALSLAAPSIRMELPIPGLSAASIEIPNKEKSMVRIREMLESNEFQNFSGQLPIIIGQSVSGENIIFSLAKAPHMLVAGATGSGKSVWINGMLVSLLYRYNPRQLQLILVDMKLVELNLYDGIPHLLTNVITEAENAINALKWSIIEMDKRYKILKQYGKRNVKDYNEFAARMNLELLPYTVFVIDELADLMIQAKNEVEPIIARLAAMSRAVGIHLVLGTQRPDVNIVTGLIKTNVPTRICFAVSSQIDSRVILDNTGGETLLGMGDGLIKSPNSIQPIRFQAANVEESEIKNLVDLLINEAKLYPEYSNYNSDVIAPPVGIINVPGLKSKKTDSSDLVLLFEEAKKLVIELQACSVSILSGNLEIDQKLAKKILDELESEGIVGPDVYGSTLREVLIME